MSTTDDDNTVDNTTDTERPKPKPPSTRVLTQAEVDHIVQERLAREREKFSDYEELKARAQQADSTKTEMERLAEQVESLRKENETQKITNMRHSIANDKGVPAELVNGQTKEEMEAFADSLLSWMQSQIKKNSTPGARPKSGYRSGTSDNTDVPSARDLAKEIFG